MNLRAVRLSSTLALVTLGLVPALFAQEPPREEVTSSDSEGEREAPFPKDSEPAIENTPAPEASKPTPVQPASEDDYIQRIVGRPGGLTSDEAARQAAAYTKDAEVAHQKWKSVKAGETKTLFRYAPQVTLTASYTRQSIPPQQGSTGGGNLVGTNVDQGTPITDIDQLAPIDSGAFAFQFLPNQWFLNLGVTVPISDYVFNLSQSLAGSRAAKKAARLNEKAARVQAAANARLAYYDWVRAKLAEGEAQKSLQRAQEQHQMLKDFAVAGRVVRADVLRQDAFVAQAELNVRRAQTQESLARENLHVMMTGGKGSAPDWKIGEDVMTERGGDVPRGNIDVLHQEAIQNRLEIQSLNSTVYALRQQTSVFRSNGYPRIEAFGNATYANPNQRFFPQEDEWNGSWDVGIRMVWTLNSLGSAHSDAKQSEAETAEVRAQKAQLSDALRTEVHTAQRSLEEAALVRETAQRGVVAAEASYQDRKQLFQAGRATAFDVLDAETTLVTSRLQLVQAYVALRVARVRFDHALGRDVNDVVKARRSRK